MCRMCLVEVEGPRGATLQPACFIEAGEGMVVDTTSEKVQEGAGRRARVPAGQPPARLPGLRQGRRVPAAGPDAGLRPGREPLHRGEAPLREAHRHLGPGAARPRALHPVRPLHPLRRRGGRRGPDRLRRPGRAASRSPPSPTEPFSSYFSGNTVQICPVGALTATPYRFTARPWDLDQVESTCTACSVGCRVAVQSSQNRLTRLLGIDSEPVNHGWLCDKGRFAFESVNGDEVDNGPEQPAEVADEAVDVVPATASQVVSLGASRGPVPRRGPRDGPLRARPPGGAARPQGGRAGRRSAGARPWPPPRPGSPPPRAPAAPARWPSSAGPG